MRKFSQNKGITIVSLIVTIVVMLILTSIIDKVIVYYNQYVEIPTTGEKIETGLPEVIANIGHDFYKLDINKLSNITLNYGDEEDIFIIDSATFEVYYLNGIEYDGNIYYTD